MAKRRASLKDKDPESLGVTPKKGKGIDLLFGEATGQTTGLAGQPEANTSTSATFDDNELSGLATEGLVDELGLPVALEEPPDDLILASAPAAGVTGEAAADPVSPSMSPFAMPVLDSPGTGPTADANDLSGLLEEENIPTGEEGKVSSSENETDLSGLVAEETPPDAVKEGDLTGLAGAEDLSGLVKEESATAETAPSEATDLSGLAAEAEATMPAAAPPSTGEPQPDIFTPPPTTAAPINVPPVSQPTSFTPPTSPAGSTPAYTDPTATFASTPPPPVSTMPPPSTTTGAPSLSAPRPAPIDLESLSSAVTGTLSAFGAVLPDTREAFLPSDELPDTALTVQERQKVEADAVITEQVLRYVGSDRRDRLFEEIHQLHDRVALELSNNKEDVSFALKTLLAANDIVIEDPRQYDEALYRVALVKTMLARKAKLNYWSYRLGIFVFLYGIIWTVACVLGYFAPIDFVNLLNNNEDLGAIFRAVWFSGLTGGVGGSVDILWVLYYRVSIKQDFDPQYLMYYLVKPFLGFVLGLVMYFLVAVGASITGAGAGTTATMPRVEASTGFALAVLLGFFAGYRQESVFDMIYALIKKISPAATGGGTKSVIPVEEGEVKEAANI
jgi:hypothetical protein